MADGTDLLRLLETRAAEIAQHGHADTSIVHQRWALYQGEMRHIADWCSRRWCLSLTVFHAESPVGIQRLIRCEPPRTVTTDSWIAPERRRNGHAVAARRMILSFAASFLHARAARSWNARGNPASTAVNRRVGYRLVKSTAEEHEWVIDFATWPSDRRVPIEVVGLTDECRELLSLD